MQNCKSYIFFIIFSFNFFVKAQSNYYKSNLKALTAKKMQGRGYTNDGMLKAALYIEKELIKNNVNKFNGAYLQKVLVPIDVIEEAKLKINNNTIVYGKDFIVNPLSQSINIENLETSDLKNKTQILFIKDQATNKYKEEEISNINRNTIYNEGNIVFTFTKDSLISSISQKQEKISEFIIKDKFYNNSLIVNNAYLKSNYVKDFDFYNVMGYIEGEKKDFVIVLSAHYDHLGSVNNIYFPGASDNASGVAMVLDLVKYFSKNKPKYTIAFMFFGAEEAGLVGSKFFVENPLFPLNKILFMLNLDILGDGEEGLQIVNATKFPKEFSLLKKINTENNFLKEIKSRGESCNSDHCPFYNIGVSAIYMYSLGGKGNYHNIYDTYKNLNLNYAPAIKSLIINFINSL